MKKQSNLSRLMDYAGNYRYFTYASWVLSAVSALVALVPFVYIWMILRDALNAAPNYAQAVNIPHYGWMAVLFAVLSYLIYIAAPVLSWMILRSLPLPNFSAKPSGSTARCSDTASRRFVATRNADRWEHISAAM